MALRTIRVQGDPILNKVCRPITEVTPKIRTLAEDMIETMYEANGVGLAAPQVGILKRIVVIDVGDGQGPYVMINPEILESSGEQTGIFICQGATAFFFSASLSSAAVTIPKSSPMDTFVRPSS